MWAGQSTALANNNEHLLCQYLPKLAQACYQWNMDVEAAAMQFVQVNGDVAENGGLEELTTNDLALVYRELLSAIVRFRYQGYQARGAEEAVSCHLMRHLANRLSLDEDYAGRLGDDSHDQTLLLFLALASISAQTDSRHIGRMLCKFFCENACDILTDEGLNATALWARAIFEAEMPHWDKFACFREIARRCPELVDVLEARATRPGSLIARALRKAEEDDDRFDSLDSRRGGRSRRWELDDDLFDSGFRPRRDMGRRDRDRLMLEPGNQIGRPRSAPGEKRRIVRQAERLIDAAEDMQVEADKLRRVVLDDR
ncbi:hypothetical protein LTR36_004132 [Oleoguttula mirabilis]|uniref:Uncharacterized protein n=1 Tax=Oleoguttula mirabilis TaxID=1507867 RepID=A0AAV9JHV2_9PEZI|nr:hypothetical protein LTR36_004132 [Oleoguttula mirabilis]